MQTNEILSNIKEKLSKITKKDQYEFSKSEEEAYITEGKQLAETLKQYFPLSDISFEKVEKNSETGEYSYILKIPEELRPVLDKLMKQVC